MKMNGITQIGVTIVALGVSLLAMSTSQAQRASGISRVGWLEVCGPGSRRPHFDIFRARLAELGFVEGKNLRIEQRFADCRYDRMPGLATDLVHAPVDVLFTMGTRATRNRRRNGEDDADCRLLVRPVRARYAHRSAGWQSNRYYVHDDGAHAEAPRTPEGTGSQGLARNVSARPEAATVAYKLLQDAAPHLGIQMQEAKVTAADELLPELAMIAKERPDALLVYPDVVLSSAPRPQQLADFAIKAHLPTIHAFRFYIDAGGLMSYGATTAEIYTSAAEQVAKILQGTRPGELPLRQATRFELVINNKTVKSLGLTIPTSLLLQADEVIE